MTPSQSTASTTTAKEVIKTEYDILLSKVQEEAISIRDLRDKIATFEKRSKDIVPKLFFALKKEGMSTTDAKDRIEKDLVGVWKKGTIRDAMPEEAIDQTKSRAGRAGRAKQLEAKRLREEQEELEEEQRNREVKMPTITGGEMMMSGARLGDVGAETYGELYHHDASPPSEELFDEQEYNTNDNESRNSEEYGQRKTMMEKALLADVELLKGQVKSLTKENVELKKKNGDLTKLKETLEHANDTLLVTLKERDERIAELEEQLAKKK